MKIGIFSDLHNRTDHLEPAMHRMRLLGCGHFIFLGDCTTPESFRRLIELTEDFPLDAVPGNNDYDVETMRRVDGPSPAGGGWPPVPRRRACIRNMPLSPGTA